MSAVVQVNKWGNSTVIRLPAELARTFGVVAKNNVKIEIRGDELVITKALEAKKYPTIQDLFADYSDDAYCESEEIDWGEPVGEEVW